MKPPPDPATLEHLVHRALRALPDRAAPPALAGRVADELYRRAARPWWCRSHAHWPAPARRAYLALSLAIALAATAVAAWLAERAWLDGVGATAALLPSLAADGVEAAAVVIGAVPALWTTAIVAVATAGFAVLAGLGAAAYRVLVKS